ncbi:MAG: glycosyltransferase [Bacteroidales bacterium]|nr:glycosyltransferase [Bacteroidales bacterium]
MKILFYETILSGHRLEYLHHLYMMSAGEPETEFHFVVPEEFDKVKGLFEWPQADNIHVETLPGEDPSSIDFSVRNLLRRQIKRMRTVNRLVKKYRIDAVFSIWLLDYFPLAPLFLKRGVKLDGVLYGILSPDSFKYSYLAHRSCYRNLYVLNDSRSVSALNGKYRTDKFKFLPDPFMPIPDEGASDFRKKYGIPDDKIVFAHFGGLTERKGTMLIVESIKELPPEKRDRYVFVFAGKIYDDISEKLHSECRLLADSANIIIKDEFCSYEYLASLCRSCNAILMPYFITNQSSGIIGYASQFGKPVIAPSENLLGRLVSENSLGYLLPETSAGALVEAYAAVENGMVPEPSKAYCEANSISSFIDAIRKGLFTDNARQ